METFIIFWFGFIVGLSAIVLLYRKRIDTLESEIDTKINLQEGKKKAEAFYSRHETFPEYLERVGAIKPKFEPKSYHENQLERYNQIIKDRPKPNFEYVPQNRTKADEANYYGKIQHMAEKEILDKFDIDIAKTCEEADKELNPTQNGYTYGGLMWPKGAKTKSLFNPETTKHMKIVSKFLGQGFGWLEANRLAYKEQGISTAPSDDDKKKTEEREHHETFPLDKNGNGGC